MEKLGYGRAQLDRERLGSDLDGPLQFVASSEVMNRKGFSLRNDGWMLDNFNANPVLLWMHDETRPPIARGRALSKDQRVILDAVEFDREDEFARQVESKYRRGFLNAVSVGFRFLDEAGEPADWWGLKVEKIRDELFYDLTEVSLVTIPADPKALQAQSRQALSHLGKELVALFDEKEQGEAIAPDIAAAVRAELERLGVDLTPKNDAPEGVDAQAAQAVLAAFNQEGILS